MSSDLLEHLNFYESSLFLFAELLPVVIHKHFRCFNIDSSKRYALDVGTLFISNYNS